LQPPIVAAAAGPAQTTVLGRVRPSPAATPEERQWTGIDIWDKAHDLVIDRLRREGLAAPDTHDDRLFTFGDITYLSTALTRTDDLIADW